MIKGNKSIGIGDDIAKVTKFIKADVAAEKVSRILGYKKLRMYGKTESA